MTDQFRITIVIDADGTPGTCTVERIEGDSSTWTTAVRRSRTPVSDDSLRAFAASYREHYLPGQMRPVALRLGLSERQCWRLKKLARERGLLAP